MHIPHLSSSPKVPLDRFGQAIAPDDLLIYKDLVCRVVSITPEFGPNAQPGQITVMLHADLALPMRANTPIPGFVRVGYLGPGMKPVIGSAVGTQPAQPTDQVPDLQPGPESEPAARAGGELAEPPGDQGPGPEPTGPRLVTL